MFPFSVRKLPVILIIGAGAWLGMRYVLPVTLPFLLAGILALLAEPLVNNLHRHLHLPRGLAAVIGTSVVLLLTILLLSAVCLQMGSRCVCAAVCCSKATTKPRCRCCRS